MAALATVDDVRNCDVTNALVNVPSGAIQCILDDEAACIIGKPWGTGDMRRKGEALVAAHIALRSMKVDGPAGPVVSSSAGGLSRSFGWSGGSNDDEWSTTSFGRRYMALRRTLLLTPAVLC